MDPHDVDEHPCSSCGQTVNECEGPPRRCCEACTHWRPEPVAGEEPFDDEG